MPVADRPDPGAAVVTAASALAARVVDCGVWRSCRRELAHGRCTLLGLWGEPAAVHMAIFDEATGRDRGRQPGLSARATFPSIGRHHPPAIRLERTIRDLYGLEPDGAARRTGRGSITAAGACGIRLAIA